MTVPRNMLQKRENSERLWREKWFDFGDCSTGGKINKLLLQISVWWCIAIAARASSSSQILVQSPPTPLHQYNSFSYAHCWLYTTKFKILLNKFVFCALYFSRGKYTKNYGVTKISMMNGPRPPWWLKSSNNTRNAFLSIEPLLLIFCSPYPSLVALMVNTLVFNL